MCYSAFVAGISPQEFDNQTLAVLRGRLVRYLMRSKEVSHELGLCRVGYFATRTPEVNIRPDTRPEVVGTIFP